MDDWDFFLAFAFAKITLTAIASNSFKNSNLDLKKNGGIFISLVPFSSKSFSLIVFILVYRLICLIKGLCNMHNKPNDFV